MDILAAASAFAVLMILFSTAVTSITETLLRISATRADVLAKSMLQFLKDDPTIHNSIKAWFDTLDEDYLRPALRTLYDDASKYVTAPDKGDLDQKITDFRKALKAFEKTVDRINSDASTDADTKTAKRLEEYEKLDDDVKSAFAQLAESLEADLKAEARDVLLRNPAVTDATTRLGKLGQWFQHATQGNNRKRIDTLSSYSFLQRLASTDIGKKLAISAEEYTLRGLTMGFERYVAASQEVFRKRAHATTMVIAIIFVFVLNIDAFRLYGFLLNNPAARDSLVEDIDTIAAQNLATMRGYQAAVQDLENAAEADAARQPATAGGAASGGGDETGQQDGVEDAVEDSVDLTQDVTGKPSKDGVPDAIQEALTEVRTVREQMERLGTMDNLPIGWNQFPNPQYACLIPTPWKTAYRDMRENLRSWWQKRRGITPATQTDKPPPPDGVNEFTKATPSSLEGAKTNPCDEASFLNFFTWFVNVLLAGFLIGLGGPFWYRFFTAISHIFQVLRSIRGQPRQESIGKSDSDQQRASQPLVHAVEKIDDHTGPQLVNLFRASAGLPAKEFPEPEKPDDRKANA